MLIYKTTCLINGKIYIGQTWNLGSKYLGSGTAILNAIKAHGRQNFTREILKDCTGASQAVLDFWEEYFIKKYDSTNRKIGYNILPGTANGFGKCSPMRIPEIAKKVGNSLKGRKVSEYVKRRVSETHKGRVFSQQHREKLSKAGKGKPAWNKHNF